MYVHNLDPVIVNLGFLSIRWYSLAYIFGILIGWWYAKKIIYQLNRNYNINFSAKILSNEQSKRNIRINTISLGLIENNMGLKVKKMTNTKKTFTSTKYVIKKIAIILKDKKINKKNIKIF